MIYNFLLLMRVAWESATPHQSCHCLQQSRNWLIFSDAWLRKCRWV